MNLRHYPLDSQKCTVEIESCTFEVLLYLRNAQCILADGYTQTEVLMKWREGENSVRGVEEAQIPQFTVMTYSTTNRSVSVRQRQY